MHEGLEKIVDYIAKAFLGILGCLAGYQLGGVILARMVPDSFIVRVSVNVFSVLSCGLIGVLLAPVFIKMLHYIGDLFEIQLKSTSWRDISTALTGLIVGLVLANLLVLPFSETPFGPYLAILLNVSIGFVTAWIFVMRASDIHSAMTNFKLHFVRRIKDCRSKDPETGLETPCSPEEMAALGMTSPAAGVTIPDKILDTSVIIDGRILDIARTGFLQGDLILPSFVLLELQTVADSHDQNKRTRGRLGLDIVNALQKLDTVHVQLVDAKVEDYDTRYVDSAVVAMAQERHGDVLTTDYNLNKVAQIQNVRVLNVNDLANAMKPNFLPGDEISIEILRPGKERAQGVGYLENGTMIVVEDGAPCIGKKVDVVLTSMLQTSAGRMAFGRVKQNKGEPR